jgi:hypothetical protein
MIANTVSGILAYLESMSKIIYGVGSRQIMPTLWNNGTEASFLLVHPYSFDVLPFPNREVMRPIFKGFNPIYLSID